MDYRGNPYKKGRQGHARNVSPYIMYRQKMKRWKYPFIALGVFAMFLISFEISGDSLTTDVLSGFHEGPVFEFTQENLELGKKGLLTFVKSRLEGCEKTEIFDCVTEAKALMREIAEVTSPEEAQKLLERVETFEATFGSVLSQKICEREVKENFENVTFSLQKFENVLSSNKEELTANETIENVSDFREKLAEFSSSSFCTSF